MRLTPQLSAAEGAGMQARKLLLLFLLLAAGFLQVCVSRAQDVAPENDLKSAFLYNFILFSEWPKDAFSGESSPFIIHVYEDEDFANRLRNVVKDKKAQGRSLQVITVQSAADLKDAHIVYIPASQSRRAAQLLEAVKGKPILTVGESPQFLEQGGIINFLLQGEELRFEINVTSAEKAKLSISSKLLRLAKTVKK